MRTCFGCRSASHHHLPRLCRPHRHLCRAPAAPAAIKKTTGCKVPKLKGLTVKKAKAALKKAGCKYKLKGKGRVRSFSPKAGTTTEATVQVKCKSKKRKKRSRKSALRVVQYR